MSVIDNFFQKFTPFIQNVLPFCCIFFLCLCFCFLSCFYVLKNKIFLNSRLIIGGGAEKGFCPPHLNYWGRVPGLPQSLRLWWEEFPMVIQLLFQLNTRYFHQRIHTCNSLY